MNKEITGAALSPDSGKGEHLTDDDVLQELAVSVLDAEKEGDEGDYVNALHAFQIAATPGKVLQLLSRPAPADSSAAPSEPIALQRFSAYVESPLYNPTAEMEHNDDGDYVRWDEALAALAAQPAPVSAQVSAREAVLEDAARICDGLAELYSMEVGYDQGYTAAASRAASEIRAEKSQPATPVAPPVATVVSRSGDDLRVGWLRPEGIEVGTQLFAAPVAVAPSPAVVVPSRELTDTEILDIYKETLSLPVSSGALVHKTFSINFARAIESRLVAATLATHRQPEDSAAKASDDRDLLDEGGENRAVRSFLMQYSCDRATTVAAMGQHMNRSGWTSDHWPEFARIVDNAAQHLTKAGAQIWIRHLLSMEAAPPAQGALPDLSLRSPALPELPKPDTHCYDEDTRTDVWSHSAEQMHAYAKQYAAAIRAQQYTDSE